MFSSFVSTFKVKDGKNRGKHKIIPTAFALIAEAAEAPAVQQINQPRLRRASEQ